MDFTASVKQQLAAICAVPVSRIRSDAQLIEYGLDSIRSVELVVAMEEHFGIEIPDTMMEKLRKVSDVIELIEMQLGSRGCADADALPIAA
jgi:acyl carrier protein